MSYFPLSFPFYLGGPPPSEDENGCWTGLPTVFEMRLLQPLSKYALEQLRKRFMFVVTTTHNQVQGTRAIFQMAFETDLATALKKIIDFPAGILESNVCERRHFIDIDKDMQLQRFLIGPALTELERISTMPDSYMNLLTRYLVSEYPRYRVCAIAAVICTAVALL